MKNKKLWLFIGIAVIAIIALIAIGKGDDDGIKVATELAAPHTITETVSASGKIYPEVEVKIAPEVSGEVTELYVKEGDSVRKGQVLMRINPSIYSSQVSQAQAGVSQSQSSVNSSQGAAAQARAQYELQKTIWDNNKKLFKDKVISGLEMEQSNSQYYAAKAAYESAQANISGGQYAVQGAQAGLSQARASLAKTTIAAPTSGIISALNIKVGERVVGTATMAGTDALVISDMAKLEVRVEVSETDIAKVSVGDSAFVETDAFRDRRFRGVVSRVSLSAKTGALGQAASSDQVTNYVVHIWVLPSSYADLQSKLSPGQYVLKPGMSAGVEIQTRREDNILSVPVNAVTTRDWSDSVKKARTAQAQDNPDAPEVVRQVVFVYDDKTKAVKMRDVQTGIQDNTNIQITAGLKNGEVVVAAPYGALTRILKDDSKVQVVKKEELFEKDEER